MEVHFGADLVQAEWTHAIICIGTFDGVHLGHREVIQAAVDEAESKECPCILVTFDRHPAAILAPDTCPPAIDSLAGNLRHFESLGVSTAIILAFDKELSETSAEHFLDEILLNDLKAAKLVVGHDFALGHRRVGNPDWLRQHVETLVIPAFEIDGKRVSSSGIRRAILDGDMELAEKLLGRPFAIPGVVVAGQKLGRTLGYPTINIARDFNQATPPFGVYAGYAETKAGTFRAAVSIGTRPAVGGSTRTIEAYLLDYTNESLYSSAVTLCLVKRLRNEENFETIDDLKRQMDRDVALVAELI